MSIRPEFVPYSFAAAMVSEHKVSLMLTEPQIKLIYDNIPDEPNKMKTFYEQLPDMLPLADMQFINASILGVLDEHFCSLKIGGKPWSEPVEVPEPPSPPSFCILGGRKILVNPRDGTFLSTGETGLTTSSGETSSKINATMQAVELDNGNWATIPSSDVNPNIANLCSKVIVDPTYIDSDDVGSAKRPAPTEGRTQPSRRAKKMTSSD